MNIKYIAVLSLLLITGLNAIMPDEILDVAYGRYAKAHKALLECQQSKNFRGKQYPCIKENSEFIIKKTQYDIVTSETKAFLSETVQQGDKATIFERSKKQKAKNATKILDKMTELEQNPNNLKRFSKEIFSVETSDKQFDDNLYNTLPRCYDHPFMFDY